MNSSYKVVLLGAFVLFTAVIAYYVFFGGPDEPEVAAQAPENPPSQTPPPPPRETLDRNPAPVPTPPERIVTIDPPTDPILDNVLLHRGPLDPAPVRPPAWNGEDPPRVGPTVGETEEPSPPGPIDPGTSERFGPTVGETPPSVTPETEPVVTPDPVVEPEPEPAPEPTPPPTPRTTPRTYTVQAGDMLSTIAVKIYGDERAWFDIAQANPSIDPKQLQVGQVIVLPKRDQADTDEGEARPPAPGQDQTYTVRPGDNLSRIARRFYGDSEKWDLIYARNRKTIGPRANNLKVGMKLIIPQPYSGAE